MGMCREASLHESEISVRDLVMRFLYARRISAHLDPVQEVFLHSDKVKAK